MGFSQKPWGNRAESLRSDEAMTQLIASSRRSDLIFSIVGVVALILALALLLTLILDLAASGLSNLNSTFLMSFPSRFPHKAGVLSAWVGTSLVMLTTITIVVPLGVASGLYLEEYAPKGWWAAIIEINITNLAGVPSIIYGLLALGLFVYTFQMGETILVAGLVLALLILPVIIVSTREAVRAIPDSLREGAYALGADRWQMILISILPLARPGILTGLIVGASRAIGETAPVITIGALTFIAFLPPAPIDETFPFVNVEWLNSPFTLMPIQMFNWISRPKAEFHDLAASAGLLLLGITLFMNALALIIRYRLRRRVFI